MTQTADQPKLLKRENLSDPIVSDNALRVLENRYLAKDDSGELMEDPKGMYIRVAEAIARAEKSEAQAYYAREFYDIMASNQFMPNSPTMMNAGRRLGMLSACFVLPVEDSLEHIMGGNTATALIQRAGGGTGYSFSKLRPSGSIVKSSGGTTAGPLVFIDMYSATTSAIQQGAFRRGANMAIMRVDHPDVVAFIHAKSDLSRWQNYNVSISMPDWFMDALKEDPSQAHHVYHEEWGKGHLWADRETGDVVSVREEDVNREFKVSHREWTIGETWDLICERAHATGEPGLFFPDKVNANNPILEALGPIEATNPCGEQPLHSWDSCNLGSINLSKFFSEDHEDGVNWDSLNAVVFTAVRFLDNVIEVNNYPLDEIRDRGQQTRRIGLGVMGWADLLFMLQIPYDSEEARRLGSKIQKFISDAAADCSSDLGKEKGNFGVWEQSDFGKKDIPMRNSFTTTIAPTGTISIVADCSGGIEPLFSLEFTRQVMQDQSGKHVTMTEYNKHYKKALDEGWDPKIMNSVFVTAQEIAPEDHVLMQAAWQEHVDSAVSKTINLDREATVEDVQDAYILAYNMGCKGITVYRDGCRDGVAGMVQPMSTKKTSAPVEEQEEADTDEEFNGDYKEARRLKVKTQWGTLHVFVSVEDGKEIEVFAQLGKSGDLMHSDLEAICRLASCWLQSGAEIEEVISQLDGIGSSHVGIPGPHGQITSIPDAVCKALKMYVKKRQGVKVDSLTFQSNNDKFNSDYGTPCPACEHGKLVFTEGCKKCSNDCGYSAC